MSAEAITIVVWYASQAQVYQMSLARLARRFPHFQVEKVNVVVSDSQMDFTLDIAIVDIVNTEDPGFVNTERIIVGLSRSGHVLAVIANHESIKDNAKDASKRKTYDICFRVFRKYGCVSQVYGERTDSEWHDCLERQVLAEGNEEEQIKKGPKEITCRNCSEAGHKAGDDCPNPKNVKCRNCEQWGHVSKDCQAEKNMANVKCLQGLRAKWPLRQRLS